MVPQKKRKNFSTFLKNQEHFVCTYVVDKWKAKFHNYIAKLVCGFVRIRKINCPFEAVNLSDKSLAEPTDTLHGEGVKVS